jgi:hypothetical protein
MRKGTHTWAIEITRSGDSPGDIMIGVCEYDKMLPIDIELWPLKC